MARGAFGKVVLPSRSDAKVTGQKAEEAEATDKTRDPAAIHATLAKHDEMLGNHDEQITGMHERLKALESKPGVAKKADEMRDEDQGAGAGGKPGRGHDTTPRARQRH